MNLKFLNVVGITDLIDKLNQTVTTIVSNNQEKERLRNEIIKIAMQLDYQTDTILSKNARPIVFLIIVISFILLAFFDGKWIDVKPMYTDYIGKAFWSIVTLYTAARSLEKLIGKRSK